MEDGATQAISLTTGPAPTTTLVTTTVELPVWASFARVQTLAPLGENGFIPLGSPSPTGVAIPTFAGAPSLAVAEGPDGRGISWRPAGGDSAAPMVFATLPRVLSSIAAVTLSTEFVVAAPAAGELTMIGVQFERGIILIHTMSDRATIPDVSDFWGTDLDPQGMMVVSIRGNQYRSMDDAVAGGSLLEQFMLLQSGERPPNFTTEGSLSLVGGGF